MSKDEGGKKGEGEKCGSGGVREEGVMGEGSRALKQGDDGIMEEEEKTPGRMGGKRILKLNGRR